MKNGWLPVALFLAGTLLGNLGACGVGEYKLRALQAEQTLDHDRIVRIENDVRWIKRYLQLTQPYGKMEDGGGP